jgi:hypothetical protein
MAKSSELAWRCLCPVVTWLAVVLWVIGLVPVVAMFAMFLAGGLLAGLQVPGEAWQWVPPILCYLLATGFIAWQSARGHRPVTLRIALYIAVAALAWGCFDLAVRAEILYRCLSAVIIPVILEGYMMIAFGLGATTCLIIRLYWSAHGGRPQWYCRA